MKTFRTQHGTIEVLFDATNLYCPITTAAETVKKCLECKEYFKDIRLSICDPSGTWEGYFKIVMNLEYEAEFYEGTPDDYWCPGNPASFDCLTEKQIEDTINKIAARVKDLVIDYIEVDIQSEDDLFDEMEREDYEAYEYAQELRGEQWRDEQRDGSYMY